MTDANPNSEPVVEDRPQDRDHFSMIGLGNGARQWVQGVGSVFQDVNRRLSTERAGGDVRPQPFAGALPKPGLIPVP